MKEILGQEYCYTCNRVTNWGYNADGWYVCLACLVNDERERHNQHAEFTLRNKFERNSKKHHHEPEDKFK